MSYCLWYVCWMQKCLKIGLWKDQSAKSAYLFCQNGNNVINKEHLWSSMGENHKSTSHSETFEIIKVRKKCCQSVDQAKKNLESIIRILKSSVWLKINIFRSEILDSISKEKKKWEQSATT